MMNSNINQRIRYRVSLQITVAGMLLGLVFVSFSNGFSDLYPFVNATVVGCLLGVLISFFELWVFTSGSRSFRFITLLVIRTLVYVLLIGLVILFVTAISRSHRMDLPLQMVFLSEEYREYVVDGNFSVALSYSMLFAFSINFTRMISRKMGQGILLSFITGTFYQPVVQNRIIMFLGVKNIEQYAAELNEFQLFDFLNDFFFDITAPLVQHQGIIYEYVEDEVVITWRPEKGISDANSIRAFFEVKEKLESRREYYHDKYGIMPKTIGALHFGPVVRAEIGKVKTQIVFHGDTMNTASRLFKKGNEIGEDLVISATLLDQISLPIIYEIMDYGQMKLKGKAHELSIYAIKDKELFS